MEILSEMFIFIFASVDDAFHRIVATLINLVLVSAYISAIVWLVRLFT